MEMLLFAVAVLDITKDLNKSDKYCVVGLKVIELFDGCQNFVVGKDQILQSK